MTDNCFTHITKENFSFSCKNWRLHNKGPGQCSAQLIYDIRTMLIFHIYLITYFIISQPQKIETYEPSSQNA